VCARRQEGDEGIASQGLKRESRAGRVIHRRRVVVVDVFNEQRKGFFGSIDPIHRFDSI
jgi:hypothetical protein